MNPWLQMLNPQIAQAAPAKVPAPTPVPFYLAQAADEEIVAPVESPVEVPVPIELPKNVSKISFKTPLPTDPRSQEKADENYDMMQAIEKMYRDDVEAQRGLVKGYQNELSGMKDRPSGLAELDLTPLFAYADARSGTKLASAYKAPTGGKEWDARKSLLEGAIQKGRKELSDQQIDLLKLKYGSQNADLARDAKMAAMMAQLELAASKADNAGDARAASVEEKLSSRWLSNDITKKTQDMASSYERMKNASLSATPASDITLVYNYMKMVDPGSVVREGEYATAEKARGVPDSLRNMYNKLIDGVRLTPKQKMDFINQARAMYDGQMKHQDRFNTSFEELAKRKSLKPENVVLREIFNVSDPLGEKPSSAKEIDGETKQLIEEAKKVPSNSPDYADAQKLLKFYGVQ